MTIYKITNERFTNEVYYVKCKSMTEARHWVRNHLDLSENHTITISDNK